MAATTDEEKQKLVGNVSWTERNRLRIALFLVIFSALAVLLVYGLTNWVSSDSQGLDSNPRGNITGVYFTVSSYLLSSSCPPGLCPNQLGIIRLTGSKHQHKD